MPSQASCEDAQLPMDVSGNEVTCEQIAQFGKCDVEMAYSHCPNSCGTCSTYGCEDSEAQLSVLGTTTTCTHIANHLSDNEIEEKCNEYEMLAFTCRGLCNVCEDLMSY